MFVLNEVANELIDKTHSVITKWIDYGFNNETSNSIKQNYAENIVNAKQVGKVTKHPQKFCFSKPKGVCFSEIKMNPEMKFDKDKDYASFVDNDSVNVFHDDEIHLSTKNTGKNTASLNSNNKTNNVDIFEKSVKDKEITTPKFKSNKRKLAEFTNFADSQNPNPNQSSPTNQNTVKQNINFSPSTRINQPNIKKPKFQMDRENNNGLQIKYNQLLSDWDVTCFGSGIF